MDSPESSTEPQPCITCGKLREDASKPRGRCDACKQKKREEYHRNKERILAHQKESYERNKAKVRARLKAYRDKNKARIKEQKRRSYERDKEKILKQQKEYYELNKDVISERTRNYVERNKEVVRERKKAYHRKNKDTLAAKKKARYQKNKAVVAAKGREYRKRNQEVIRESKKRYAEEHKEALFLYRKKYYGVLRQTPHGALNHRISTLMRLSLKNGKGRSHWEDLVGYTRAQLQRHLEKQFTAGMTWEAFMRGEMDIDHIIPVSVFTFSSPEDIQFKTCWALQNLRPMWASENRQKGAKLLEPFQQFLF